MLETVYSATVKAQNKELLGLLVWFRIATMLDVNKRILQRSFGKASQRYRGSHGLESCRSLRICRAYFATALVGS